MSDRRVFADELGGFELHIAEQDNFLAWLDVEELPNYSFENPEELREWFKKMRTVFDRADAYMKSRHDG